MVLTQLQAAGGTVLNGSRVAGAGEPCRHLFWGGGRITHECKGALFGKVDDRITAANLCQVPQCRNG
jgi:hypothetical protein